MMLEKYLFLIKVIKKIMKVSLNNFHRMFTDLHSVKLNSI